MDIESFAKQQGQKIADAIFLKYDGDPTVENRGFLGAFLDGLLQGGYSRIKIRKQAHDRALHEATSFFLRESDAKFDEEVLKYLRSRAEMRLKEPIEAKKMSPEELLAFLVMLRVEDTLLDKDFVL